MSDSQTPSSVIVAGAHKTKTITDAAGRKIAFRSLSILEQARLLKAIGPEQSENGPYVRLATIAASVMDYDGVPNPSSKTADQVEASIGRLGDDGFAAIVVEHERAQKEALDAAELALNPVQSAKN